MSGSSRRKTVQHHHGTVGLRYIGNGAALPDVPARDLTAKEASDCGYDWLIASGLYMVDEAATPAPEVPPAESEK